MKQSWKLNSVNTLTEREKRMMYLWAESLLKPVGVWTTVKTPINIGTLSGLQTRLNQWELVSQIISNLSLRHLTGNQQFQNLLNFTAIRLENELLNIAFRKISKWEEDQL